MNDLEVEKEILQLVGQLENSNNQKQKLLASILLAALGSYVDDSIKTLAQNVSQFVIKKLES